MKLQKLSYSEFKKTPREWKFDGLTLKDINLIVGRNAVGKTRTINVISGLARLLSEEKKIIWSEGNYEVCFTKGNKTIEYDLQYQNKQIENEKLIIDGELLLDRHSDGTGKIFFAEEERQLRFQTPKDELAALARRDQIQHPFLDDLYSWGENLITYKFGEDLGQDTVIVSHDINSIADRNIKKTDNLIPLFISAKKEFGDKYINKVIADMKKIGYFLDDIEVTTQQGLTLIRSNIPSTLLPEKPYGLSVKESDLDESVEQKNLSQGMFRSLSLLCQLNYFLMSKRSGTIIVDDIGEGLDFNRSSKLISLLISIAKKSNLQLIMTTNDRFVMNNVPIEYWTILERQKGEIHFFNINNSEEIFNDFIDTGLNNFDMFSSKYYLSDSNKK